MMGDPRGTQPCEIRLSPQRKSTRAAKTARTSAKELCDSSAIYSTQREPSGPDRCGTVEGAEPEPVFHRAVAVDLLLPTLPIFHLVLSHQDLDTGLGGLHVYIRDGRQAIQPKSREGRERGLGGLF